MSNSNTEESSIPNVLIDPSPKYRFESEYIESTDGRLAECSEQRQSDFALDGKNGGIKWKTKSRAALG
jgi:hypothetical protein